VRLCRDAGADAGSVCAPVGVRLLSDQLTPVLAYRRLVAPDERTAPSFLLESVEGGERQGRHSILGARPLLEVVAHANHVRVRPGPGRDPAEAARLSEQIDEERDDPMSVLRDLQSSLTFIRPELEGPSGGLSGAPLAGWFGFASYDTVRYAEPERLDTAHAPPDDRRLPDLHFALYDRVVVFDHVDKVVHALRLVVCSPGDDAGRRYDEAIEDLERLVAELETHSKPLPVGRVERVPQRQPESIESNMTRRRHAEMVERAKEYIRAGDIFQVVLGQRFHRRSGADPFDVYRALRVVNPSPYMFYVQAEGCLLVASSPEILCRVRRDRTSAERIVTNRPLAGTRRRGRTEAEDQALERELLSDEKERAEHIMLVDLGRNDLGRVCRPGSLSLDAIMEIERYSHVMHISSTVTGALRNGLDCWDALRAALPVGTISGAPKIRAMQIIDELEPVRRGPYGGGVGYVSLDGDMDIALALRTIVVPTALHDANRWTYHLQAAGGIVADSRPEAEYDETVNKAAAMQRAIDLAERAFSSERAAARQD